MREIATQKRLWTAASAALIATPAFAAPIELTAQGASATGSTFELVLTYESSTMPVDPDADGLYQYPAVLSARVWIDGDLRFNVADPGELGLFPYISIANNTPLAGGPVSDLFGTILSESDTNHALSLTLRDFDATAFDDHALPTALDLMDFEKSLFDWVPFGGPPTQYSIDFLQTRIVPAPGSAVCAVGLLLLTRRRR
jgi:hypothetical protein